MCQPTNKHWILTKFDLFATPHPPPTYQIDMQSTRLVQVLGTVTQSRHLWTIPYGNIPNK